MKTVKYLVLASILAIAPACSKKSEEKKADPVVKTTGSDTTTGSATTGSAGSDAGSAGSGSATTASGSAGSGSAAAPVDNNEPAPDSEYVEVLATHAEPKPVDPVHVTFEKFKVAKAKFDPKKIEGGTATIEVDLASIKTNSDKRTDHLEGGYLEVSKYTTMKIDIDQVKKGADDKHFTAQAKVDLHGVTKTFPVEFEVVDAKDDWIKVKGEHKFSRLDFKVGKPVGPDEGVAESLTVRLQVTLKNT